MIYDLRDYVLASQSFGCTINWTRGLDGAVDIDPATGKMYISAAFAEHVWHLSNWSISGGFAAVFPELRRRYTVAPGFAIPPAEYNIGEFLQKRDDIVKAFKSSNEMDSSH